MNARQRKKLRKKESAEWERIRPKTLDDWKRITPFTQLLPRTPYEGSARPAYKTISGNAFVDDSDPLNKSQVKIANRILGELGLPPMKRKRK